MYLNIAGFFSEPENGVHLLNGHSIRDANDEKAFEDLMCKLSPKVIFVDFDKAVNMIKENKEFDKPYVAFSFDDGFLECYSVFSKVLDKYNIKGAFFINPNYVSGDDNYIESFNCNNVHNLGKKPMRWEHLLDLSKRGHIIGGHTMDHIMINSDDENFLNYQIAHCKHIIEEKLNINCEYFAFPYGRQNDISMKAVEIACSNYRYVFSQSNYKYYYSFDRRIINRRHFEVYWPYEHVKYFTSCKKQFL